MSTYAIIFLTLSFLTLIGKVSSHGKERPCYNGYAGLIDFGNYPLTTSKSQGLI